MARTPSRTRPPRRQNAVSEDFKAGPPEEIVFSRALMEKVFVENPRRNPRARRRNGFVDYMKGVEERGKKKGRAERAVGKAQTATAVVSVGAKAAPKVAAKVAAKVGAKAGARAIPFVGEALMVVGGGKELAKAGYRHYKHGFDRRALKTDVAKVGAGILGVEDFVPDYERPAKKAKRNPRDVFGPKKPLFGPYTYRVKQNSNGDTLIAVYHGSKRIAHIDAFWAYSMRAIEEHEEDEARRGTRRRLVCATDLRALGAEGKYPNVLAVGHAFMDDDAYKGKGIGRAMYEAMMVEGFAVRQTRIGGQPGPMFFIPDECKGAGNTSAEAQRVWASLARDYPSQGTSIRVDAPPVIGSRAKVNPRRRWNPDDDYRMRHRPSIEGEMAHELGAVWLPDDVLTRPQQYTGFREMLREFWPFLLSAQGKPRKMLRIYRALPKPHMTFREGDWVTLSLAYAKAHQESNVSEGGHIIAADVPASSLRFAGDDLMEWGYWGPTVAGTPVRRANPRRRNPSGVVAGLDLDALAEEFTEKMANGTTAQMRRWAKKHGLAYVGEGESRAVFGHATEPVVIKFVFSSYGQEANQNEARAWREANANIRKHLVPIVAADPEGRWLVMERVKTMRANQYAEKDALASLQGCGFLDFGRPNFSSDGRMLDYGQHLWFRWSDECRTVENPRRRNPARSRR